jgi:serine protease Do
MGQDQTEFQPGTKRKGALACLLGGTAALIAVTIVAPATPPIAGLITPAHGQAVQKPVGFADIVPKIKPAVISVRVKIEAGSSLLDDGNPDESPLERFFRRFGQPDEPRLSPAPRGRNLLTGQGSGFFISADGYAVTNGHVVDKAKTVEVTTDDNKVHTAKVIGIDSRSDIALIKVDGANFPFVRFADASPRVGDWSSRSAIRSASAAP